MNRDLLRTSKFLSLILRHKPETVGLKLDAEGWVGIADLLTACKEAGHDLSEERLREVVAKNDKTRFVIRGGRIRANQGHSVPVSLNLKPRTPPAMLYHGTAARFIASIQKTGLRSGKRQYVHLSKDRDSAAVVGKRHGKPIVLAIDTAALHADGQQFFLSDNGVWLTGGVSWKYVSIV